MSLRSLSDSQVLSRLHKLVGQEREITLLVLVHLNEVERRKLHLKLGYASLFDYCTSKLGYSASAAVRRIRSARCAVRFPVAYEMLKKNELTVSTLSQVSRALTVANHGELFLRIRGKSQREVEAVLAEYQPTPMPPDRVRTVVVRVPVPSGEARKANAVAVAAAASEFDTVESVEQTLAPVSQLASCSDACEKSAYNRNGCDAETTSAASTDGAIFERRVLIQFTASEAFTAKLERIRSLAGHRLPPNASLEQLFELAMDLMIDREDHAKRIERREKRRQRTEGQGTSRAKSARQLPVSIRDDVFKRDGGRCTFVGPRGTRCGATVTLQVDHRIPVASGGTSIPSNLRLLCAQHNRLEAVRLLGESTASRRQGKRDVRKESSLRQAHPSWRYRRDPAPRPSRQ